MAELVQGDTTLDDSANVSASLAVLAGIAAVDAACCAGLGRRSRSPDHRDAQDLVRGLAGGDEAATALARLLDVKDSAQYGVITLSAANLRMALRQARLLIDLAARVVLT